MMAFVHVEESGESEPRPDWTFEWGAGQPPLSEEAEASLRSAREANEALRDTVRASHSAAATAEQAIRAAHAAGASADAIAMASALSREGVDGVLDGTRRLLPPLG